MSRKSKEDAEKWVQAIQDAAKGLVRRVARSIGKPTEMKCPDGRKWSQGERGGCYV